jgi:imidazolonepropionase-like amidohydrolase
MPVAVTNVNVVDVIRGEIRTGQTVLISNGHIDALGPNATVNVPAGATRVSGDGQYLLPGLWDMHVHLRSDQAKPHIRMAADNAATLDLFLPNGIVGIREMGGDLSDQVMAWREEIHTGKRSGPRILTAGRKLDNDPPAWAGSLGVKTEEDARQAVRQMKQAGADFIKVYFRQVPANVLRAAVDEAHKNQLKVTGHKPGNLSIQEFLETGIDGMEHAQYLAATDRDAYDRLTAEATRREGKAWSMDPTETAARLLELQDDKEGARVWQLMAEKQFWVTPTLAVSANVMQTSGKDFDADDRKRYIPAGIWATWDAKSSFRRPIQGRALTLREASNKRWEALALAALKAGVPMILGTDCGANNNFTMPGFSIHEEMQALVRAGFTPADVLRMATLNAAKWRGVADFEGSVEKGKVADLLLLRSNPLEAIRHTEEVEAVFQGGRYYPRQDLDRMLARAETKK